MNKEMKTAEEILHAAYKILEEKQDSSSDTVDPILIAAMEEYAEQLKSPAISSNEGETLTDAQVYAECIDFDYYERKGFYFLAIDAFKAGQSQHTYTEATCKKCTLQSGNLSYSETEVLAIIEQVKEVCAENARVVQTKIIIPHLGHVRSIDKKSITDIDFKYLLK